MNNFSTTITIYVAQNFGNDTFCGTLPEFPLKTMGKALEIVREIRNSGYLHPLTIALAEDYFLDTPLCFEDISNVTLTSFRQRRRLIGGFKLGGWQEDCFMGNECLSARLPERKVGEWDFTDLYVCGKRCDVTRFPKEGLLEIKESEEEHLSGEIHISFKSGTSRWFVLNTADLAGVDNIEDAIINYYHYWIDEHSPIESYDRKTGKLVMKLNSRFSVSSAYGKSDGETRYYLTNVPNTFSAPGEWYLDRKAGIVYYIPHDNSITAESIEAFVPTIPRLVDISGEDIHISGLEITVTTGDYVSTMVFDPDETTPTRTEGEILYGSDVQSVCMAPGAVSFANAANCSISDCSIHGVGIHAVNVKEGCHHINIENNDIYDICAGGVRIAGGDTSSNQSECTTNITVTKNRIFNCGRRYAAGCGILIIDASNNIISDNEIHDIYYSGISVGWVWGYAPSVTHHNLILRNHIYNVGIGNLSDLGGIYTLGMQRGTVIKGNVIHDVTCQTYGAWGIYLDEGSSFITIEDNTVYKSENGCLHLHYGSHNTVRNNIFYNEKDNCVSVTKQENHLQLAFEGNVMVNKDKCIFKSYNGINSISSNRNLLYSYSQNPPIAYNLGSKQITLEEWQGTYGQDRESIVADPKIKLKPNGCPTLAKNSPAFKLGFKLI